jgi:hypothetical protein
LRSCKREEEEGNISHNNKNGTDKKWTAVARNRDTQEHGLEMNIDRRGSHRGPVRLASLIGYDTMFFSRNKSTNNTFQPDFSTK